MGLVWGWYRLRRCRRQKVHLCFRCGGGPGAKAGPRVLGPSCSEQGRWPWLGLLSLFL